MPPSGIKKNSKLDRKYEHIKEGYEKRGESEERAEEIAARTVNKQKSEEGKTKKDSK